MQSDRNAGPHGSSIDLCTEIIEVSSKNETAVCNLGSINLGRHVTEGKFDFEKLAATTVAAARSCD
jgi:ribonucleoside-diphosphate reductase alpha chain